MKLVEYKGELLSTNSEAYQFLQEWLKAKGAEKDALQKKLDKHLKEVNQRYQQLHKPSQANLVKASV